MSSILTNDSATIALMTLQSINTSISEVQTEIATGRRVAGAEDNAAVWAIAKTMEADVLGYRKVADSLALGGATLAVARKGAETITELLTEIKAQVVTAQEENVDRGKIQNTVSSLRDQIAAVVEAAQFNGLNLLNNRDATEGAGSEQVLGFLQRDAQGVRGVDISIGKQDLSAAGSVITASGGSYSAAVVTATLNLTRSATLDASGITVSAGMAFSLSIYGTDGDDSTFVQDDLRTTSGATQSRAEMATAPISYVARDGDGIGEVLSRLSLGFASYAARTGIDSSVLEVQASAARSASPPRSPPRATPSRCGSTRWTRMPATPSAAGWNCSPISMSAPPPARPTRWPRSRGCSTSRSVPPPPSAPTSAGSRPRPPSTTA